MPVIIAEARTEARVRPYQFGEEPGREVILRDRLGKERLVPAGSLVRVSGKTRRESAAEKNRRADVMPVNCSLLLAL
ncbi:MAG: hypothetical protein LBH20_06605 [Treponema sp.]|nr:hypothetical protein [Treponema sp.]